MRNGPSRRSFSRHVGVKLPHSSSPHVMLPLAAALIYLLAFTVPYWLPAKDLAVGEELFQFAAREPWRGALFYVALAILLGLYLAAYLQVAGRSDAGRSGLQHQDAARHGAQRRDMRYIVLWAALFCLLLIPVQPITSSDVYGYVFQGRIVAGLGENPFAHLFREFAADPSFFLVTFPDLPASAGYGPLWIALEAALSWLAGEHLLVNLLLFKVLAAGLHLACAFLVYATLGRLAPGQRLAGTLFYAWNPVLLYELVGNGHNDVALAALALCGFFLLSRDRGLLAIPCLVAAVLVKPVAALWLPPVGLWLLARTPGGLARLRRAAVIGALALVTAAVAYAPFWAGRQTFAGLVVQSNIHGNSLPSLLVHLVRAIWPAAGTGTGSAAVQGVKWLTVGLFAPFYLWQLRLAWDSGRKGHLAGLVVISFDLILFYLVFVGFQFWPWYLTWLMVPAALLRGTDASLRRALAAGLGLMAPLLYFPFGWMWARAHLPAWFRALLVALPLLTLLPWAAVRAWQKRGASGGL
jgi:hypothetical protein